MNKPKPKRPKLTLDDCANWAVTYTFEVERRVPKVTKIRLVKDFVKRFWSSDMVQIPLHEDGMYDAFVLRGQSSEGSKTMSVGINRDPDKCQEEFYAVELAYLNIPHHIRKRQRP
jgi:hypothetical protein